MRRFACLLAFILTFAAGAGQLRAQTDVTGTWELSWEGMRGATSTTFVFHQDGSALTGTAQRAVRRPGAGEGEVRETEITDGKVEGHRITFTMAMGMGERAMTFTFSGTVDGDTMEGTMATPRGETPFTGIRKR